MVILHLAHDRRCDPMLQLVRFAADNLGGRDAQSEAGYGLLRSVVQHEFGHVLGFKDQYRGKKGVKRSAKVENRDLMYRTGVSQHFMEYHIRRLYECAAKGRLPVRRV